MNERIKVLVTAGNTRVPIDQVRGIDNIFTGRTGAAIASYFAQQGCDVTILASHPSTVSPLRNLEIVRFITFDDLLQKMERRIRNQLFHVIIHSAAVSDYRVGGMFRQLGSVREIDGHQLRELIELDRSGKIGSEHPELWMKMVPTIKIVDQIREPWGFHGTLVKFKLQVGMNDAGLIEVATRSMKHSNADFIVANTLEGLTQKAFIISAAGGNVVRTSRNNLPSSLYKAIIVK